VRKEGVEPLLRRFRDRLETTDPFDADTLDRAMHAFTDAEGVRIGQIIHAVRVAVTGKAVGFGLFDGLAILGREACLVRIDHALARVSAVTKPEA
jgi:glutamyl-tRNA synthetase